MMTCLLSLVAMVTTSDSGAQLMLGLNLKYLTHSFSTPAEASTRAN